MTRKISIRFISEKLKKDIFLLKKGDDLDRHLYNYIRRAFEDIENDLACCIKIPKKLWPREYNKYNITNLWKYDLPSGWRLIFFIEADEIKIVAVILEWFSHKEYDRIFNY